jgi:hypothetical protein
MSEAAEVIALTVRVAVLEKQQATFEKSAISFMQHAANEENSIHDRLDEIVSEVHKLPEMVSKKINESRTEIRDEIDKAHPRRHEVVTPRALYAFAGILALVLVAGMTTTMVVWDKIDNAVAASTEQVSD